MWEVRREKKRVGGSRDFGVCRLRAAKYGKGVECMRSVGWNTAQYPAQDWVYGKKDAQQESAPRSGVAVEQAQNGPVPVDTGAQAASAPAGLTAALAAAQTARSAFFAAQEEGTAPARTEDIARLAYAAGAATQPPDADWLADAKAQNKGSMGQAAQAMAQALAESAKKTGAQAKTAGADGLESSVKSLTSAEEEEVKNLLEMMQEANKKAKEMREKLKLPKNAQRYGEAAVEAYARLKRARSASQVSAASGYARRQLAQLQSALHSDSENAPRIRAAIRSLKSAVSRASRKKRELAEEQQQAKRAERAEEEKRRGDAARIKAEQQRRKAVRAVRESGYVRGAVIDHMQQEYLAQQRAEAAERAQSILGDVAPAAAADTAALGGAAAAPVAAPAAIDATPVAVEAAPVGV